MAAAFQQAITSPSHVHHNRPQSSQPALAGTPHAPFRSTPGFARHRALGRGGHALGSDQSAAHRRLALCSRWPLGPHWVLRGLITSEYHLSSILLAVIPWSDASPASVTGDWVGAAEVRRSFLILIQSGAVSEARVSTDSFSPYWSC